MLVADIALVSDIIDELVLAIVFVSNIVVLVSDVMAALMLFCTKGALVSDIMLVSVIELAFGVEIVLVSDIDDDVSEFIRLQPVSNAVNGNARRRAIEQCFGFIVTTTVSPKHAVNTYA